ncbi:glutathione ABC transporter substrate-binding protein [Sansalvadorimonas verongulae]|uniref:glutathione ABC transporter substrate-binding protein n=1 Tax=Sansalvadorimonas verongulae TaxID=2172824 RepID=UPI0012BC5EF5|nr:glutathione ABC transporter substrate-binding protein [Sansalvadorimonas verongulae]MTI14035.1 glutathione ABC transporter substrate-binding protein [Sansalvadorimonas verongulae]
MKTVTKAAATGVMAIALAACGGPEQSADATDSLIIAQGSDAKTLDPHTTNDQPSSRVAAQIYSQLVETDENMNIVPGLAESWTIVDERTTDFKLREGVKFHNGEELKASDVKFSFERMIASPTVAHITNAIESVEVLDDYNVRIVTADPFGPLLYHLTHTASSILNEKAVTAGGSDYGQNPIGTGPYKFVDWAAGDRINLRAFGDFYDGKQAIENVTFRNIVEGTNRAIALETGEVDISYDIEPIDKDTVRSKTGLTLIEDEALATAYYGMNVNKAPFDNVKVRQAVAYAINSDDIIQAVVMGAGRPSNSPIGPKVFGYNPDAKLYQQNIEKAKQLMAEAGHTSPIQTTIWTNDNPVRVQIAQILQAQLREIGINMSIEVVEWGAFLDGTSRGDHDTFILGWTTVTGDADYGLYALFNSETHGGAGNRSFYSNPRVDDLLELGRTSTTAEQRRMAYRELQDLLQEEVPTVSLYSQFQNVGMKDNIGGFKLSPAGHHKLKGVYFVEG